MVPNRDALYRYLLGDLYGDVEKGQAYAGLPSLDYYPGATVRDVYKLRLLASFFKKLEDVKADDADAKCLDKFLLSNSMAGGWRLNVQFAWEEEMIGEFKNLIDNFFYPNSEPLVSSFMDIAIRGRLGPGASIGANGTDFYTKLFSSELTASSPEVYQWYLEYISWFPDWSLGEFDRLMTFGLPKYTSMNLLSFVRKTRDISRSICTEPTLNMFFQLGLGEIIGDRLRQYFGINLSDQPEKNRALALRGSLDDSLATIDLESASDSISTEMCEVFLPEFLLGLLHRLRSTHSRLPSGEELRLNMISTMGNGFTFPLQTCLFACVVAAVAACSGVRLTRADAPVPNWGVFGDDIICPGSISGRVMHLLKLLGFRVNSGKSYTVGPFRESCGVDAFMGVNVRGVYIKTLLTQESRFVAINLLNEWVCRSGIRLDNTIGYLRDSVRDLAVPPYAPPDSGIRSPKPVAGMWHREKQRYYYKRREPVVEILTIDDKDRILLPSSAYKKLKRRKTSLPGLYYSFIGGYIRNSGKNKRRNGEIPLSLKQGESPHYRTVTRVSPFWGPSLQQVRDAVEPDFWQRWNTAACPISDESLG